MRLLSFLAASGLVLSVCGVKSLKPKGPPCPDGNGLYAVGCNNKYLECINGVEFERSCPDGLYFDILLSRCERRSNTFLCEEQNARKTLSVRQKSIAVDCGKLKDGDYPYDKNFCSRVYLQCANGLSNIRKCPFNQLFSLYLKRCDYESNCFSFNEGKLTAAAAFASPVYDHDNFLVTAEEVEEGPKGVNCSTISDDATFSDLACSPYFWQCANGKMFRKTCPSGLIYVVSQNLCDFPQGVKECPEYDGSKASYELTPQPQVAPRTTPGYNSINVYAPTTTTTPPPSTEPSTKAYPIFIPEAAAPAPPPVHDAVEPQILAKCNSKSDGFYEIAVCHNDFLVCANGVGRIITCADKLVFDPRVNACEFLEVCKSPSKQEVIPQLHNHGGFLDKKPDEIKIDFDCSKKKDGRYVKEPCLNEYFGCHDRIAFRMNCPADLVYNMKTETCDFAQNCKNFTKLDPYVQYERDTDQLISSVAPTTVPSTQPPTEKPTIANDPTTLAPQTTTHAVTIDNFSCANLEEGNYASGPCKNIFYTCYHDQVSAIQCPASLVFNPYNGQCDYESNVPDCGGADRPLVLPMSTAAPTAAETTQAPNPATTLAPDVPVETTQAPVYAAVESSPSTHLPKYAAYCERLADGNYGKKCQPYFFQCANFETTVITCPTGLFYSLQQDRCGHPQDVEGCPGYIPPTTPAQDETTIAATTTSAPKKEYPNIDYTTSTPGPVDTTPIAEAFSCYGRVDGIYALPYCSRDYVQCMAGRSLVASCAPGLYYSEGSGLCDYKENIPICKLRKGADSISDDACVGRSDGYYSAGCSSHYFSCIGEQIRKMMCRNKLKFSEKKGICEYPSEVAECGIATPTARAPPAVPSDFCTIRPNGLHAFGQCSPHYVVCENGRSLAGTCAAPLVFNENNQLCDYKSNNKECGSDYVPSPSAAVEGYSKQTGQTETVGTTIQYASSTLMTTTTASTPASDKPETTTTPYTTQQYTQSTTPYTTTNSPTTQATTTTSEPASEATTTQTKPPTSTVQSY